MGNVSFHDMQGFHDPSWDQAFAILIQLRDTLTRDELQTVIDEGTPQGLRFTAMFDGQTCVAIAGWRLFANTHLMRVLYVDDLCVDASRRSQHYGHLFIDELRRRAIELGAHAIDLDSGVQRFAAHRFYMDNDFHISSHHFRSDL
ncbi:MAG: GNAT family N-acetyltransferase [Bifidobacterium sp.]|uniref:GNAT family N-acetyltransferase n=1 Tax=Bifidobacterium sp. TaxID=41200 RepID=UPI0039E963AC